MNREVLLLVGILVASLALAAVLAQRSVQSAANTHQQALVQRDTLISQLRELARLEAGQNRLATQRRPDNVLVSEIQDSLANAGLARDAFDSLVPRDDRVISGTSVRVQQVQVRLKNLDLAGLGAWLASWQARELPWLVTECQLEHQRAARGRAGAEPERYTVLVQLAAPYFDDGATAPARQ